MNLNQITIPSTDLNRAVPFYQKLGLQLIVDSIPRYARFVCPDGNSTFSIHHTENLPKNNGDSGGNGNGIWIYFECENLDEYVKTLQAKGITFEELPTDKPWLWREARLKDPDNNQLILFKAGDNRINPPWRINSNTEK